MESEMPEVWPIDDLRPMPSTDDKGVPRARKPQNEGVEGLKAAIRSLNAMRQTYVTTYCNFVHTYDGRPLGHECRYIPPAAMRAEIAGSIQLAARLMQGQARPLRTVVLYPYRRGPSFRLEMFDLGDLGPQPRIGYIFTQRNRDGTKIPLFAGTDYRVGAAMAIDSDSAVAGLLGFLTLRPGDTDAEYFEGYSKEQRSFAEEHAEAVGFEASVRFERET